MTLSADPTAEAADELQVELLVGGMTSGACANRVERTLNKIPGVTASVNYATEKASVRYAAPVAVEVLVAAVEKAGYTAELPAPPPADDVAEAQPEIDPALVAQRTRLLVCLALTAPVVAMAMVPAWEFVSWQWRR
jgi:P-type Cu+ transporter